MKKVLKEIFKWLVLVFISFSVIFTAILSIGQGGITEIIGYKISNFDNNLMYNLEKEELEVLCDHYQQMADTSMNNENIVDAEYLSEEQIEKQLEFNELYKKYPSGFTMVIRDVLMWENMSNLYITSLVIGIVVGTAIYLMLDKNKNGVKVVIAVYILFILILGFEQGFRYVAGDDLTLLDRWMFPDEYIIPVTIAFALVIVVRIIRQKEIARKLNEKLKERKEEKSK